LISQEQIMVLRKILVSAACLAVSAASAGALELKSPDVANGGTIAEKFVFNGFGCAGGDLSPALNWSDPPAGTKSFAVLAHDPDAPTGGAGFWHWVVYNIPATATGLPQGVGKDGKGLPEGATQVATDFGAPGYGGPCPPKGDAPHHYHFTVYALKTDKIELPPHATASLAGYFINANALGKATLTATYGR
jgi:Raf kinase inhibitor-like YbhB/YbcL family protein